MTFLTLYKNEVQISGLRLIHTLHRIHIWRQMEPFMLILCSFYMYFGPSPGSLQIQSSTTEKCGDSYSVYG